MRRLSEYTTRILSLSLVMIMLAVTFLSSVLFLTVPQTAYADTVTLIEVFTSTPAGGTWIVPLGVDSVEVLVVAGGGGGGSTGTAYYVAGGGGAGGLIYKSSYAVTPGVSITVTVGEGGSAGSGGSAGGTGGNSVFGTITAHGGGGGGGSSSINGVSGGSGGGGMGRTIIAAGTGAAGTAGEGKSGGNGCSRTLGGENAGGGGGGNTTAGIAGASKTGGAGGAGADYSGTFGSVGGDSGKFAGGGGGGVADASGSTIGYGGTGGGGNGGKYGSIDATSGKANTGGGGGGAGKTSTGGGAGGSGVVIVKYTQTRWNLTISAGTGGTTNPAAGTYTYNRSAVVSIVATPSSCYRFVNWSGTGAIADRNAASTTITMSGASSIQANFAYNCYTLTTSAGSGGTVSTPVGSPNTYVNGSVVNIVATPSSCYSFNNWSGSGVDAGMVANVISSSTTITMNGNYSLNANFVLSTYILSVAANNSGGTPYFSGSSPFNCGTSVSIYANTLFGHVFAGWSPIDGITNASAENTTVIMNQSRALTALYAVIPTPTPSPTPTPTPIPPYVTSAPMFLSWHITPGNFSLTKIGNYIVANISANAFNNMGKRVNKQLTIYIAQRPSAAQNIWGQRPVYAAEGLLVSGKYNLISGDVRINGTVKLDINAAEANVIDGILTCNDTNPSNLESYPALLSYNNLYRNVRGGTMPDLGVAQNYFPGTNLSVAIAAGGSFNDSAHEYVFPGDISLTGNASVWESSHNLKTGMYYSPGTITLDDHATRGNVTFIANRIVIHNNEDSDYDDKIVLTPYYGGLLFWANGNSGSMNVSGNGDILIDGDTDPSDDDEATPCVDLEGVLYAPNGEIELAGGGAKYMMKELGVDVTLVVYRAELDKGAIIAKYITIAGSYWTIYRW